VGKVNWIGHVNRTGSQKKESQVFNNSHQGNRLRGQPKNRWWNCVQRDSNKCKLKIGKRGKKTELTGRSPLRGRRSALELVPSKKKNKIFQNGISSFNY
jgi:hypothetical protein